MEKRETTTIDDDDMTMTGQGEGSYGPKTYHAAMHAHVEIQTNAALSLLFNTEYLVYIYLHYLILSTPYPCTTTTLEPRLPVHVCVVAAHG